MTAGIAPSSLKGAISEPVSQPSAEEDKLWGQESRQA